MPAPATQSSALAEVAQQSRRAQLPALAVGVLTLAVTAVLGYVLIGVGVCLGLSVGLLNARVLTASMQRFIPGAAGQNKRFVLGGFSRLGAITVGTLLLVVFAQPLGIGVLVGLAVFQAILLGFAGATMYRQVRGA